MTDRTKRWRERKQAEGLVQVRVWVPAVEADALVMVAAALRPEPVEIAGEVFDPGRPGRTPSPRMQAYAERIAERNGVPIPPPMKRCGYRLSAWIRRNKNGPSWLDERFEEKRIERVAELQIELERLS